MTNFKNLNVSNSAHIGVLYYVDIPKGHVLRYDPKNGGTCTHVEIDNGKDPVSFVIPSVIEKEYQLVALYYTFTFTWNINKIILLSVNSIVLLMKLLSFQ